MSVEHLKEYVRRCATEPELREQAKALGVADLEQHIRHSASLGLAWSADDMTAFRKEMIDAEDGLDDLTEEELEQVAGGVVSVTLGVSLAVGVGVGAGVATTATAVGTVAGVGAATAAAGGGW